jgi:hypothetical protein
MDKVVNSGKLVGDEVDTPKTEKALVYHIMVGTFMG